MKTCKTINGYRWSQEQNRLLHHVDESLDLYWDMPSGFSMPSPSTLSAAEFILLSPYRKDLRIEPFDGKRQSGVSIAFSGGVDSAAALRLMPDPTPIYNHSHDATAENALMAVREVGGYTITTNQKLLAVLHGRNVGYYGFGGFSVASILLSEHLGHDTLSDGNIIEFIYMYHNAGHGTLFNKARNFRPYCDALETAGLFYCMPVAGMTEVTTTRIAPNLKYIMGCTSGAGGKPCMNCIKCYRKEAIKGNILSINKRMEAVFAKQPIPVLATYLWAKREYGLAHPSLDGYDDKDISWVDGWYPRAIEYVPEHLRPYFLRRLDELGVKPLDNPSAVEKWSAFRTLGPSIK